MLTILKDNYSRVMSKYKKTVAIGMVFIFQILVIILKNIVHDDVAFIPLMYLVPISILFVCLFFLNSQINMNKSLFY